MNVCEELAFIVNLVKDGFRVGLNFSQRARYPREVGWGMSMPAQARAAPVSD